MPRGERPLETVDGPLLTFAAGLRRLRRQAGSPTYRELAARAHYSISTLSGAAAGQRLPTLAVTLAYVRACDGDPAAWERTWRETAAAVGAREDERPAPQGPAPYVGLAAFRERDAQWFFGRERLVAELVERLGRQRLVAVIGASGSGKSSLLRAGLVPQLRGRTVVLTPGAHPLRECAQHLAASGEDPDELAARLARDPSALHEALRGAPAETPGGPPRGGAAGQGAGADVVLVVDQFEELFTQGTSPEERSAFVIALVAATRARGGGCRVVLGVRADFYAHCTRYPDLVEALRDAQVPLGPMTLDELRRAIVRPAARAGLVVEGALLAALTVQAQGRHGVLPLLSHALLETWRRRRGNALTLEGFQATGGVEGALTRTAEGFYGELTAAQREVARQLFLRLTALGEGTEDTRRRITTRELDATPDTAAVVEHAARARLLTLDRDRVELTHEALIRCWPRLHGWLTQDREALHAHRQLTEAAQVWESLERDPSVLYRGTRLAAAARLAGPLNQCERAFLEASAAAQEAQEARGRRRRAWTRALTALLVVLLLIAVSTAVSAVRAREALARQRDRALAGEAAAQAVPLRGSDPGKAAQLALAAYRMAPGARTRDALVSAVAVAMPYRGGQPGHTLAVTASAFRPDGRLAATGSIDGTVRLWDLGDPLRPRALPPGPLAHAGIVTALAVSHDGRLLAVARTDGTVALWDIGDPLHPARRATLTGHRDTVFSVAFSPRGRVLATGSYDDTVRLWDAATPSQPRALAVLTGHRLNVKPVAFSPDGRLLASGSDDRTVRLWDVRDPRHPVRLRVLRGHTDMVDALALSPDGRLLASGSDDRTVLLWDIADPRRPRRLATLRGNADIVTSLAFSPGSRLLLSGSADRTARLWDVTHPGHPQLRHVLTGHLGAVNTVAFSPDGRLALTGSSDHTAQLWQTGTARARALACTLAGPPLTRAQWEHYLPSVAYRPPCRR